LIIEVKRLAIIIPIGPGVYLDYPYDTIMSAVSYGRGFKTKQLVTIGNPAIIIRKNGERVSIPL
jgi:hypothetical protein